MSATRFVAGVQLGGGAQLALGISANTASFSVVSALRLTPLPYTDPDRLVRLVEHVPAEES